jgi:hypothetical protein
MMVGNGCTDFHQDTTPATIDMLYEHNFIGEDLYRSFRGNCTGENWMIEIHKDNSTEVSDLCIKSLVDISDQIHNARLNPYNIYGKCYTFEENDINQTSTFRQL